MKERPILFSGAMVNSLLAGTKTQTRRNAKVSSSVTGTPEKVRDVDVGCGSGFHFVRNDGQCEWHVDCPYGVVGDRLWVRETFSPEIGSGGDHEVAVYRATHPEWTDRWRPSISMPRWASRITLEITNVRVERLQSISEEDARAEGVSPHLPPKPKPTRPLEGLSGMQTTDRLDAMAERFDNARAAYAVLWESINGKTTPWVSNPFVWAVSFLMIEGPANAKRSA